MVISVDGGHPRLQLLTASGVQHGGEVADVSGQRGFRAPGDVVVVTEGSRVVAHFHVESMDPGIEPSA